MSFQYVLRRTLPVWSWKENLQELDNLIEAHRIDELLIKVDTEEFSHGQPELQWMQNYRTILEATKELCDRKNIRFSINPWITHGHTDRGRNGAEQLPGLQTIIDIEGNQSTVCACPLSRIWQEHICRIWEIYASLHPYAIWIEDDIRSFNHGAAHYGCFCDLHLARFAAENGLSSISRDELADAIWQQGEPHIFRKKYLDMLNKITCETVTRLTDTIWKISPETNIGLMTSGPRAHVLEGRNWQELFNILDSSGKKAFHRPTLGAYRESSPLDLFFTADSIAVSRYAAGSRPEFTEVENIPYSRYAKSISMTAAEILISAVSGCAGGALNLYDHYGSPMLVEPKFGEMMAQIRPDADALLDAAKDGEFLGIRLLHREKFAYACHANGSKNCYANIESGNSAATIVHACGFSVTYGDENAAVTMITGELARALSDDECINLLHSGKGVFLDAAAARIFAERGFASDTGIKSVDPAKHPEEYPRSAAEEFYSPRFGGREKMFIQAYIPTYGPNTPIAKLNLIDGAEAVSVLCDCDAERLFTMSAYFVNRHGTRIFTHGMEFDKGASHPDFHSPNRIAALRAIINTLAGGKAEFMVHGDVPYLLGIGINAPDGSVIAGIFNLSTDICSEFKIDLAETFVTAEHLVNGKWEKVDILQSLDSGCQAVFKCSDTVFKGEFFRFKRV